MDKSIAQQDLMLGFWFVDAWKRPLSPLGFPWFSDMWKTVAQERDDR